MPLLIEWAVGGDLRSVPARESQQLGRNPTLPLEEDATDGVVIGKTIVDLGDKPHQFFRRTTTPDVAQAGGDFRRILKFNSANDLGAAVLKMIEMNSVFLTKQGREVGHIFGQLRHGNSLRRICIYVEDQLLIVF